jgi:hypothetical protein
MRSWRSDAFYDDEYSWKLDGSTLRLATVKNQCPDRVAQTILTSRPGRNGPEGRTPVAFGCSPIPKGSRQVVTRGALGP